MTDEPVLGPDFVPHSVNSESTGSALPERIRRLLLSQPFAVLCTQGDDQAYGSLVAFAVSDDLRSAVFSTPVTTRKFQLLAKCERVALLVDNRCKHLDNMMEVEAVTATGRATRVIGGSEFDCWSQLLLRRHSYLEAFVRAPTVALFRVEIARYFHVVRFQEVQQWVPAQIPG